MPSRLSFRGLILAWFLITAWIVPPAEVAAASVWKVSDSNGGILYLGGSVHALHSTDYPLPSAYNRAFDAAAHIVFEDDPAVSKGTVKSYFKRGEYPKGDSLKNHVDPRTYDYLRRVFSLWGIPEQKFSSVRPWFLVLVLSSPELHGVSHDLGIEGFLEKRARANSKPISGLESFREHMEVFSGLTDRQCEMLILMTFIPQQDGSNNGRGLMNAWRRGDADTLAHIARDSLQDFPSFAKRVLDARSLSWLPKIEGYLHSGKIYFVVVGAGHIGGPSGLLPLLKARGYRIEQI